MRIGVAWVLISLSFFIGGCASMPRTNEDSRLEVDATISSRRGDVTTNLLYIVRVRNASDRVLTIRRVEVEPIGGGRVRLAYISSSKKLEPGAQADFQVWAELEPTETVMGIGDALARVIVSFDDRGKRALGSYLVNL